MDFGEMIGSAILEMAILVVRLTAALFRGIASLASRRTDDYNG